MGSTCSRIASQSATAPPGETAELAAPLARVARAGHETADAQDVDLLSKRERFDLDPSRSSAFGPWLRPGTAHSSRRRRPRSVRVICIEVGRIVTTQEVVVVAAAVHDQVVDDPTAFDL